MKVWEKILIILIAAGMVFIGAYTLGYSKMYKKCADKEPTVVYVPKEKIVHDTITDIQWKTRYIDRIDTAWLDRVDTLNIHDTVQVLIPIERVTFDTLTADSVRVKGSISGYNPSLDTLTVTLKTVNNNVIVNQPEEKKLRWGWGFALGFGFVYGK